MKKLLKIVSYAFVIYPILATIWQMLPVEITSLIPDYTQYVALLTGGTSLALGGTGLLFSSYVDKAKDDSLDIFNGLYEAYTKVKDASDSSTEAIKQIKQEFLNIKQSQSEMQELIKLDLKAKLSNPLIDENTKALINKILGDN